MSTPAYDANSIVELDPIKHLLKRPALTLGSEKGNETSPHSTMQRTCVREVYENSVDEAMNGFANKLNITFYEDHSFEVMDNGRGIPVDVNKNTGKSGIMQAIGTLQSGRNFDSKDNKKSTGTNGLGASAVAVFAKRYDCTVYRNNKKYSLSFKAGIPGFFSVDNDPDSKFTELKDLSKLKVEKDDRTPQEKKEWKTGTKTRVWLNLESFPTNYYYDEQDIIERLKGAAFLTPNLTINIKNHLRKINVNGTEQIQEETYNFPDGLSQFVESLAPDDHIIPIQVFKTTGSYIDKNVQVVQADGNLKPEDVKREVPIEVAFVYGNGYENSVKTFVNTVNTHSHGVHLNAVEKAMTKVLNDKITSIRGLLTKKDAPPIVDDYREGLTMIVSIYQTEPQYTSQSKEQLSGSEVQKAVLQAMTQEFEKWLKTSKNNDIINTIAKKVARAAKTRQKAREQREINRKKNEISSSSLPSSLIDCAWAGSEDAELYIVEGDSAAGAIKGVRDGDRCAILGVRGKVINAKKASMVSVLKNAEVQDIIKALGAGAGKDFDIDKMRYGRIFIAVDADPDGSNIAVLLYNLFWSLFKDVILEGRLYKVETPLFVVTTSEGSKSRKLYARDEPSLEKITNKLNASKTKYYTTRLKGLGQSDHETLYESAINSETRIITQITIDDLKAAEDMLELVAGDDSDPRKAWFEANYSKIDEDAINI